MTSVFDTHPPLMYVIISYVKKLGFETSTHPPFMTMSLKFTVLFLRAPLLVKNMQDFRNRFKKNIE